MKHMPYLTPMLVVASLVLLERSAQAITPTGFMPGFENAVAGAVNMVTGVVIPALSWGALIALAFNCYFALVRIPLKIAGLLAGVFLVGAGLPWLAQLSGGTLSVSFTL